jgi:hypothetical protein
MKYTLKEQGKESILYKDGEACICPFKTMVPMMQKNFVGDPELKGFASQQCSSSCALFNNAFLFSVTLCNGNKLELATDEEGNLLKWDDKI